MPERNKPEHPTQMELDILRSFGWAVVELESVLFERYTQISAKHSLISLDAFRKAMRIMESKGYLSSTSLHGYRAFKKQIVDKGILRNISPKNPNEEIRLALASLRAKKKVGFLRSSDIPEALSSRAKISVDPHSHSELASEPSPQRKVTKTLIMQSQITGDVILQQLEKLLQRKARSGKISPSIVSTHIHNLRNALSDSEEVFLEYIEQEFPELITPLNRLLSSKGSD
ncbi:MAG: hypothetical protein JW779_08685, partial [Candidatus Thorarchaeota archaeon]|nr:hypothetical protein [Candidatus Thorarchaeota archaeon]